MRQFRRSIHQRIKSTCGCTLLINPRTSEWAIQSPCSPEVWNDWEHQKSAAAAVLVKPLFGEPCKLVRTDEYGRPVYQDEFGEYSWATDDSREYALQLWCVLKEALKDNIVQQSSLERASTSLSDRSAQLAVRCYQRTGQVVPGDGRDMRHPKLEAKQSEIDRELHQLRREEDDIRRSMHRYKLEFAVELRDEC